jgi:hypothetical protein
MDGTATNKGTRSWWRVTYAGLLALALAGGFAVIRPLLAPVAVRDAARLLRELRPDFDPAQFRADSVVQSADGRFFRVHFVRIEGRDPEVYAVSVPARPDWVTYVLDLLNGRW